MPTKLFQKLQKPAVFMLVFLLIITSCPGLLLATEEEFSVSPIIPVENTATPDLVPILLEPQNSEKHPIEPIIEDNPALQDVAQPIPFPDLPQTIEQSNNQPTADEKNESSENNIDENANVFDESIKDEDLGNATSTVPEPLPYTEESSEMESTQNNTETVEEAEESTAEESNITEKNNLPNQADPAESDTPAKGGGLMSGIASKAINQSFC